MSIIGSACPCELPRASSLIGRDMIAYALLFLIPLSLALRYLAEVPPVWIFMAAAAAIAVLADWVRRATEQLAERAGSTIGGLLNVSFGNTAALVLALFVLFPGDTECLQTATHR